MTEKKGYFTMREVVITGMGAVTPVGNDIETFWKNITEGVCGIEKISRFDTEPFKAHVAGMVKDYDPPVRPWRTVALLMKI